MSAVLELNPIPQDQVETPAPATPPAIDEMVSKMIEAGPGMASLTKLYLRLRATKDDVKRQASARLAPIDHGMAMLEAHFLAKMNEMQVDSLKNEAGTPYRSTRVSITVADNQAFVDFVLSSALEALPVAEAAREKIKQVIVDSGQFALIEARASKSAVEAYLEETSELPPGLNRREEATVNVRTS